MASSIDHQLLFCVLAFQTDLINREQLVSAVRQWRLDNQPSMIEDVFLKQGVLGERDLQALHPLVQRHLDDHQGDAVDSLASLSSASSVLESLDALGDAQIDTTMSMVVRKSRDPAVSKTLDAAVKQSQPSTIEAGAFNSTRYRVLRPHAKGGLGEVSVAKDIELSREVALKEIQQRFADDPNSRSRFILEAEVTGGLEHPGIVPVYGLGQRSDGRPYYAMRFIRGNSLKDAADHFHSTQWQHDSDRRLQLRSLLGHFVDVCNAIEYAHSRGVLHRDLKPGNIMLGKYGETLVVDWGLAKTSGIEDAEVAEGETTLRPSSAGSGAATVMGSAIGTPAFMPPEQAAGKLEEVGPASDVYSLGATLHYVLTGQAPFAGRNVDNVLKEVIAGDYSGPRTIDHSVPKALDAICKRAMSLRQDERYGSPLRLAEDVDRFLADEPVRAFQDPWHVRFRRWVRKHPKSVTGLAVAVSVGVISLGVMLGITSAFNRQLEATNDDLERKSQEAERVSTYLVKAFRSPDPRRDGTTVTMKEILDRTVEELSGEFGDEPGTKARLLDAVANTYIGLSLGADALPLFEEAHALRTKTLGRDDELTLASQNGKATALQLAGRNEESLLVFQELVSICRESLGEENRTTLKALDGLAGAQVLAGDIDKALELRTAIVQRCIQLLGEQDADTLLVMNNYAATLAKAGDDVKSIEILDDLVDRVEAKHGAHHPNTLDAKRNLAVNYAYMGKFKSALEILEPIFETEKLTVGEDHQSTLSTQNSLAEVYRMSGDFAKGIPLHEDSLRRHREELGVEHQATWNSINNLANAYMDTGQFKNALDLYEELLEVQRRRLPYDHPALLTTKSNLAHLYHQMEQYDLAIPLMEESVQASRDKLGDKHPDTLISIVNLGIAYINVGRIPDSLPLIEEFLEGQRNRLEASRIASFMKQLGDRYFAVSDFVHAEMFYRRALDLRVETKMTGWRTDYVRSLRGESLARLQRYEEAETELLSAYQRLLEQQAEIPLEEYEEPMFIVDDALSRIVELYLSWDKPSELKRWQAILEKRHTFKNEDGQ